MVNSRFAFVCALLFPLIAPLVAGCADRSANAVQIATDGGLARQEVSAGHFRLTVFSRMTVPLAPVVVYVEGDGLAWLSRTQPSPDPTPRDAVGLRLAALDAGPNVVYVARPCQFTRADPRCRQEYWTDRRFAEEVVVSISAAIDRFAAGRPVHLVGYSGGGAIAALLAARRGDVASLRTLAGNLDHEAVNRHHGVTPMRGSLNAIDVASRVAAIPQVHVVGGQDTVVPPMIAERFVAALGDRRCASIVRLNAATHTQGWDVHWAKVVQDWPAC